MPNGDPDWGEKELPKLTEFFAPITDEIREFAQSNRLIIERYYHQLPSWWLKLTHPEGGDAYVEIRRIDDGSFDLFQCWWVDDPVAKTRSSKHARSGPYQRDAGGLTALLQRALDELVSWRRGEWDHVNSTYEEQQRQDEHLRREALQLHLRMLRPPEDAG